MIDLTALTEATVDTFRLIPEVMEILEEPERVMPFTFEGPSQAKPQRSVYQTPSPSILVAWLETVPNQTTSGWWLHRYEYVLRGPNSGGALDLLTALMNGIPVPGDGQKWRLCGFMDGVEPARILRIERQPDQEDLVYVVVLAEIKETGDA